MGAVVDDIYKNILDKFNPGARQMINAGKAYLKALHAAAAASRLYVEAITKLARQSQQGTWGGSADIGSALMKMVEVYKEIQAQQMNILKAFYVDLLVPLETNLEKDTKVVQSEQKRFLQQHKQRSETYSKAVATMKKHRKKQKSTKTGLAMDKELKSMQVLEEERSKLDAFCEQSLKNAMTQERRRYGFVLERQCSLAKHYLAYHTTGMNIYQAHLDNWGEVAKTREYLPEAVETMFASRLRSEQKRFLQQHKQRSETYSKAVATMKKHRKKQKSTKTGLAMDKELKSMQVLEEERSKLDAFCEQSLKNAMTQERRRYGFVLERQCSLAKHYLAYHTTGMNIYQAHLDNWGEVAKTREYLPEAVETMFASRLRQVSFWSDDDTMHSPRIEDDRISLASQLRKTKSMDASCLDVRAINDISSPTLEHHSLTRAKSDFNLMASNNSLAPENSHSPSPRPKSMAVGEHSWENPLARAMYAYLSSGENQLSFLEGDIIALMGDRNKGWQFGENLRTQCSGWFPLAYTEPLIDDSATTTSSPTHHRQDSTATTPGGFSVGSPGGSSSAGNNPPRTPHQAPAPVTRFGDTLAYRQSQIRPGTDSSFSAGPPGVPAPVVPASRRAPPPLPPLPPHPQTLPTSRQPSSAKRPPPANASLHSSNDSGFSNDPPPAPEVDYSDDEAARRTTMMKNQRNSHQNGMQNGKKELASVRGWLSEATNDWYPGQNKKESGHRPLRHTSSVGVITTLGRSKETLTMDNPKRETREMSLRAVDIPYEKKVKRTKSLWKFRKSEDLLEGMALWKHRSLVDVSSLSAKDGTPLPGKKSLSLSKSLDDSQDNEDVSEETIVNGERKEMNNSTRRGSLETSESENEDSESCIVVDDHLKAAKVAPLLPRTRLIRNNTKRAEPETRKLETDIRRPHRSDGRSQPVGDMRQQWFDPWDHE